MCAVHLLTHLFECHVLTGSACFVCESEETMCDPQTNNECYPVIINTSLLFTDVMHGLIILTSLEVIITHR